MSTINDAQNDRMTEESWENSIRFAVWMQVVQIVLIPVVGWMALEVWDMGQRLARMETQIENVEANQDRILNRVSLVAGNVEERVEPTMTRNREAIQSSSVALRRAIDQLRQSLDTMEGRDAEIQKMIERLAFDVARLDTSRSDTTWEEFRRNPKSWLDRNGN